MLSFAIGKYSSRLNVTTFLKLSPSSLCIRTNSSYTFIGEEPVAKPKTQVAFFTAFSCIKVAISLATAIDAVVELSKITLCIFSKRVSSKRPAGLCFIFFIRIQLLTDKNSLFFLYNTKITCF